MRILFICGSLEPGRDGVGDYTRRLAGECIRQGHEVQIVALNERGLKGDPFDVAQGRSVKRTGSGSVMRSDGDSGEAVNRTNYGSLLDSHEQDDYGTPVTVYRWPNTVGWRTRGDALTELISSEQPDVVSIQFVPYSFNPKGLPFEFVWMIRSVAGKARASWHIMFHELWLGIDIHSSKKSKAIGALQKRLIQSLVSVAREQMVTTQTPLYKLLLDKVSPSPSSLLKLFGNIPLPASKPTRPLMSDTLKLITFGNLHEGGPVKCFLEDVSRYCESQKIHGSLRILGRTSMESSLWLEEAQSVGLQAVKTGELPYPSISAEFLNADIGVSTTPWQLSAKSGAIAAMREHGLTVISVSREWASEQARGLDDEPKADIFRYPSNTLEEALKSAGFQKLPKSMLPEVAAEFLAILAD